MAMSDSVSEKCVVCGNKGTLICSQCKLVRFCSVKCQRSNWKKHKPHCRAIGAYRELCEIVQSTDNPKEHFDKSMDEVIHLEQKELEKKISKAVVPKIQPTDKTVQSTHEDVRFSSFILIEDMPHISLYQIHFDDDVSVEILEERGPSNKSSCSILKVNDETLRLPCLLDLQSIQKRKKGQSTVIRVQYIYGEDIAIEPAILPISELNHVCCQVCRSALIQSPIYETHRLPSTRWDDMLDYLICYPGQSTVEFGGYSNEARVDVALQDEAHIVLHTSNLGDAVTIICETGYGEGDESGEKDDSTALLRGDRPYRNAVGGATVACSKCSSVLGFAPVDMLDTIRLIRHRVVDKASLVHFVVYEMIRYSENKAVFSFVVTQPGTVRSLRLRLLSWNAKVASSDDFLFTGKSFVPKWRQQVKLLYGETVDPRYNLIEKTGTWTLDICCPPEEDKNMGENVESYARLHLSSDEWRTLKAELESLPHLSEEECAPIIQAKLQRASMDYKNKGVTILI